MVRSAAIVPTFAEHRPFVLFCSPCPPLFHHAVPLQPRGRAGTKSRTADGYDTRSSSGSSARPAAEKSADQRTPRDAWRRASMSHLDCMCGVCPTCSAAACALRSAGAAGAVVPALPLLRHSISLARRPCADPSMTLLRSDLSSRLSRAQLFALSLPPLPLPPLLARPPLPPLSPSPSTTERRRLGLRKSCRCVQRGPGAPRRGE